MGPVSPGRCPFKAKTRVRIPLGTPLFRCGFAFRNASDCARFRQCAPGFAGSSAGSRGMAEKARRAAPVWRPAAIGPPDDLLEGGALAPATGERRGSPWA